MRKLTLLIVSLLCYVGVLHAQALVDDGVYTLSADVNKQRGEMVAADGYNYPVLDGIDLAGCTDNSTAAMANGEYWYVQSVDASSNTYYIYNIAKGKYLVNESGNVNFGDNPYVWTFVTNAGNPNYLNIKDASKTSKVWLSSGCSRTAPNRPVQWDGNNNDGGALYTFTRISDYFATPETGKFYKIKGDGELPWLTANATSGGNVVVSNEEASAGVFLKTENGIQAVATGKYLGYSGGKYTYSDTELNIELRNTGEYLANYNNRYAVVSGNNYMFNNNNDGIVHEASQALDLPRLWAFIEVEAPAATVNGVLYETLQDAVEAAQASQTLTLWKNSDETIVFPANVTINKNGFTANNLAVAVAKIGDTLYASIEDALNAATEGQTIILVADVTCTEKPVFNKGGVVNVDINGHQFVSSEKARVCCVASADGKVASNNIKFVRGFGWEAYYNAAEKFRVFPTLDEAVAYKSGTNAANIYPYEDVVQDKDITFCTTGEQTSTALTNDAGYKTSWDLNGFTVLQQTAAGNPLESTVLGEFTLLDSSAEKTGKWIAGAYNGNTGGGPAFIVNRADAHLILQGGTISIARNGDVVNTGGLINTYYGTLTVDGATLQMDDQYGIIAYGGNVVVNSGEFVLGENNSSSVFAMRHYSDASVTINANLGGTLYAHSSATATVNVAGVKYVANGTDYLAPAVGEGLVAQGGVVGYPVAKIGETGYLTLEAAVAAAQAGNEVVVVADVADVVVDIDKNLTISGSATLNNVGLNANGADALTVKGLDFTGNSWINSGTAEALTVSGITANVAPVNTSYTNSRSAFISLGRVEAQQLALTVEDSKITVTSQGPDAILGWAAITEATIKNNVLKGSSDGYFNNADAVKFMAIADGAEFDISGNEIYSNYNGIVFAQNTTRDNAYSVEAAGNKFVGGADHIWIEVSGGDVTHATFNATSDNTVNGNAITANDIKYHSGVIKSWSSYAGVDVVTDADGKVIGGTLASFSNEESLADGFVFNDNGDGTYGVQFASYIVLPEGVNSSNYAAKFGDNTVTDGTNYYATLQAAVEAVVGQANAVLYCKPGADVGSLQHAPVTSTLTVYGNGADVTGDTERDFDLGNTDPSGGKDITADMTLTVKHLNGCGAWGAKATEHTVNLVFENCANMGKVFITGTTGTLNITMTDCAFEGVIKEAVYSNADGAITLTNVAFSNLNKAVNLNHKAAGTQTVTINGCTFTDCGADVDADQIPVRVLSSVEGGKSVLAVTGSTFTGTPEGGADILLDYGVGHTTASVSGTAANVVVEKENNVGTTTAVKAEETVEFTTALPVAQVGETKYMTLAEAVAALKSGETLVITSDITPGANEFIELNGKTNVTLAAAEGVEINGNIQVGYHQSHTDNGVDRTASTFTVDGLTVNGTLTVCSNDAALVVKNTKAAQITVKTYREGMDIALNGNTADGSMGTAANSYGMFLVPNATGYNLAVDGNTFKNINSHAFVVQGCGDGSAVTAANSIAVTNNIFESWGTGGKDNRAAFKIWADTKYAPAESDLAGTTNAMRELVIAIAAGGNTYSSTAGNTVQFDAYGAAGNAVDFPAPMYAVAKIGEQGYATLADAVAAVQDGETITILAGTHSEGTIKLPATLNNVTIKGAEGAELKDMTISAADGNAYSYVGLTFDGITFDNSRILLTGWRNGEETIENLTVTNCTFKNLNDNTNTAPVHINKDASKAVKNFTFTNNVIDGATGGQKSGIYAQVTGEVKVENNIINNVSFRPYVIQVTTDDGIADNFTVKGNTFSGSAVGRAQGLGNNAEGTDNVNLVVSNNIFKGITDAQQICYWKFNPETTTADLSKNYYDVDIVANPSKIYFNSSAADNYALRDMNVFPIYTALNENGTINTESAFTPKFYIAQVGDTQFETLAEAVAAAKAGDEIKLLANIEGDITVPANVTLNGNGFAISGGIFADGDITFAGVTTAADFDANVVNTAVNIPAGASLQLTGSARLVIGHGATFNITGTITDAKTADKATLVPSLKIAAGASITGNGVTFNVNNAYIVAEKYCSSKNSNANGTFNFNITNSIWEQTGSFVFTEPTNGMDPTFNLNFKDGVLNSTSHLVFAVTKGEIVFDNSNVNGEDARRQIENRSKLTVKNGSVVYGAVATSSNAKNPGTLIVENATYAVTGEFSGSDLGTGNIIFKKGASFTAGSITKADITIDATGMEPGEVAINAKLTNFAGTLEVINNDLFEAAVVDGKIVLSSKSLAGEGTEAAPFVIDNIDDLRLFAMSVNAGNNYAGKYVKLGASVDLLAQDVALMSTEVTPNWEPIGTKDAPFKGTFDGNGETVSNMIVVGEANQGFFGYADAATIKNLNLENVTVTGTDCVGAVAGQVYSVSLIDNCHVSGNIKVEGQTNVGGITGKYYTKVSNCSVIGDGAETSYVKGVYVAPDFEGDNIGGIMGHCGENNNLAGNTVKNITVSGTRKVGGIVGIADQNTDVTGCVVENVVVETTATAEYANSKVTSMSIAALIGQYQAAGSNNDGTVTGCTVKNVTFNNVNDVTVDVGPIVGGARGGSSGMLAPSTDVTASGNNVYMTTITGSTNEYLMVAVAKIGEKNYYVLDEAVAAAQAGETVTLLADVTTADGIVITDKNLVINLNGKTYTTTEGASTNNRNFKIVGTSVVTIKNGTMVAAGDYSSGAYGTVRTEGSANVTLEGLKLYNYRGNGLNIKACGSSVVTINDTEIYSNYGGGIESAGGTIEIANVKVEQKGMYTAPYNSMAISVNSGGKVTVNSGTFSTECITAEEANNQGSSHGPWVAGVLNSGGTLIINGGTFSNDNFGENSLATYARGAILADTKAKVEINGGTFNVLKNVIDIQNNLGDANNNPSVVLAGGTYNADPRNSAQYGSNLITLADGYVALPGLSGNYVVGVKPTATVNNLGMTTVEAGDYMVYGGGTNTVDMPLSFVMQFLADQTEADMATSPFADWYGDFVITFTGIENGSFTADGCYLAGHYGSFGWVKVPVDGMTIENGVRYPVMLGVGMGQKYDYICSSVQDFKCALYLTPEILAANPNIKVNLELGVVDNSQGEDAAKSALINNENVYSVTDYTYDAEDFVVDPNYIAELVIDDAEGANYTNDTEKTVGTLTYKRTLVNGKWNALYLPFKIELTDELLANYDFADYNQMISSDTNGDRVPDSFEMELFIYTGGTLDANYPYFVRPKNEEACSMNLVLTDATLYPANENSLVTSSVKNTFKLSGTYSAMDEAALAGKYAISFDGDWSYTVALKPYRLYLTITDNNGAVVASGASKSVRIVVRGEDGTTEIEGVYENPTEDMIFDLQGRRVLEPQKGGMYIINGKKVIF